MRIWTVGAVLMLNAGAAARGQIIVDQEPTRTGGPAADTDFIYFGQPAWQLLADNFTLASSAEARRVTWWGFYDRDNPPMTETMRIRFYDSRPGDGLPGNILFEQSFLNPSRVYTGHFISVGILPREFVYVVDLAQPFPLDASRQYWFEAVQIGDRSTTFRWEYGTGPRDGIAFINNREVDWQTTGPDTGDLAFQFSSIPEPGMFTVFSIAIVAWTRKKGGAMNKHNRTQAIAERGH